MAWPRLSLRPSLLLVTFLSIIILSIKSEESDDAPQSLTINHLSLSESHQPSEGIDQDEIVEYRQPSVQSSPIYRPFRPFKRYPTSQQHNVHTSPGNSESIDPGATQRRKKDCGFPVLTRRLFGPVMKRSAHYFANTEDEVQEKNKEEDKQEVSLPHSRTTRNAMSESHSGGCLAKRQWIDMGADYYPRYVKSYHCSSSTCDKGFGYLGECTAKHYTTKVLKRITTADSTSVEDCDQILPEDLRVAWKLIPVTVTTCCDCVSPSRMFGLK